MGKKDKGGNSKETGAAASAVPFQFQGGFSVGAGLAGEKEPIQKKTEAAVAGKKDSKKKQVEEEENEEEEEEEEDDEDGDFNLQDLIDLSSLSKNVQKRIAALKTIQDDYSAIDAEYKKARIELERSFLLRKVTLYESRRAIVVGDVDVPDLPPAEGEKEEEDAAEEEPAEPEKGIPSFWATVLNGHPQIGDFITEEDLGALQALSNLTCEYDEGFTSFKLLFHFEENEFFTDRVLTKTYNVAPDLLDDKAPSLKSTEGCEINWQPGKNLCVEEITKKQRAKSGRNKGQVRTIKISKPKASFFQFFSPRTAEDEENEDEDEQANEEKEDFKLHPEEDYDIGHAIRTSIIPEAVLWFTGEAALAYDFMYGDEEEEDEDEDEEGDDDEEEEEEEEAIKPRGKPVIKKPNKGSTAGDAHTPSPAPPADSAASGEKPAECKQN